MPPRPTRTPRSPYPPSTPGSPMKRVTASKSAFAKKRVEERRQRNIAARKLQAFWRTIGVRVRAARLVRENTRLYAAICIQRWWVACILRANAMLECRFAQWLVDRKRVAQLRWRYAARHIIRLRIISASKIQRAVRRYLAHLFWYRRRRYRAAWRVQRWWRRDRWQRSSGALMLLISEKFEFLRLENIARKNVIRSAEATFARCMGAAVEAATLIQQSTSSRQATFDPVAFAKIARGRVEFYAQCSSRKFTPRYRDVWESLIFTVTDCRAQNRRLTDESDVARWEYQLFLEAACRIEIEAQETQWRRIVHDGCFSNETIHPTLRGIVSKTAHERREESQLRGSPTTIPEQNKTTEPRHDPLWLIPAPPKQASSSGSELAIPLPGDRKRYYRGYVERPKPWTGHYNRFAPILAIRKQLESSPPRRDVEVDMDADMEVTREAADQTT